VNGNGLDDRLLTFYQPDVIESSGEWIETALQPLADHAELQQAAVELLDETLGKSPGKAAEAVARWEALDAKPRRPLVKWAFIIVLAVVSAWAWTGGVKEGIVYWRINNINQEIFKLSGDTSSREALEDRYSRQLNDHGRLLMFGDLTKNTRSERKKCLWDSSPDNPAYFMEYASAYLSDHEYQLPPDFLETARHLDPDNSWFTYLAAAVTLRGMVEPQRQSKAARDAGEAKTWTIRDQRKMDEFIALLHQASGQARFDSYQNRMTKERIRFIPRDDFTEFVASCVAAAGCLPELYFQILGKGIAAKSWQCAEQGDREGFFRLLADVEALNTRWADSETGNMIGELVFVSCLTAAVPNLHAAAVKLELTEKVEQLKGLDERLKERQQEVRARQSAEAGERAEARASTLISTNLTNYVKSPPPLTDDDLKPGRLTDHEFFSRACCLAAWLLFAVSMGLFALARFRLPAVVRRLVPRIGLLLRPVDYGWLIGAGILLPYAYMMIINRFTPLGGRDWSIGDTTMYFLRQFRETVADPGWRDWSIWDTRVYLPMAQFLGMALLMLVVPVLVARWRLSRRIAMPDLCGGRSWMAWLAVMCTAVFIPLAGWIAPEAYKREIYQPWLIGLAAVPVVWLLVAALRALFGRAKPRLLYRGVIARALVPVYAAAMLLMAAAALGHKAAERYWFQCDTLMRMDPAFPAMSPYEYEVARQLRAEIREILRGEP